MRKLLAILASSLVSSAAFGDSVDGTWFVVGFTGESWFTDVSSLVGQSLTIDGGVADGILYGCPALGQSMTYTTYENDDFFANPEFEWFRPLREGMELNSERLFVHRITCAGNGDAAFRRVLYPFVTNEARKSAWYLYEGGVFELYRP